MLGLPPRASETEFKAAVAMEARRVLYRIYLVQAKREQDRKGQTGQIRKPYRGRDGLVVFSLEREQTMRFILWATGEAAFKTGAAQQSGAPCLS